MWYTVSTVTDWSGKMRGIIKWYNYEKGFGFVEADDNGEKRDVFIHFSYLKDGYNTKLQEGNLVEFDIEEGSRGEQAVNLYVVEDDIVKTFVIVGEYGRHDDYMMSILYAGADEKLANEKADKFYDDICKQVWVNGVKVQVFKLSSEDEWEKEFDLLQNLEKEVEEAKKTLEEKVTRLLDIKAVFGE